MDYINILIDNYNIPILSAFLLGLLSSISPCTLAANIAAVAYISKDIKTVKNILLNGLFYTLGRGISYTLLGMVIYLGTSSFSVSGIFEKWGYLILGPLLMVVGLVMVGVIKFRLNINSKKFENIKNWLATKGYVGSLLLGMLLALAFCPYSGVLFFGALIPLVISSPGGLFLPILFALGTGLPVIIFSFFIAFSTQKIGRAFNIIQKIEKNIRFIVAFILIIIGIYYLQFLITYIFNSFINI